MSYRDTTAVVDDRDGIVRIDGDLDGIAVACQSLIHRIVYDLIYQMMKSSGGSASDVHARPFPDCLQALPKSGFDLLHILPSCIYPPITHFRLSYSYCPSLTRNTLSDLKTGCFTNSSRPVQVISVCISLNAVQKIVSACCCPAPTSTSSRRRTGVSWIILLYQLNLRKLQGQRRRPLLSLGAELPDIHTVRS